MSRRKLPMLHTRCVETFDDDLATDKSLDRQGGETVEAKAESREDDHDITIVAGKVVENIPLCGLAEDQIACQGHDHACEA